MLKCVPRFPSPCKFGQVNFKVVLKNHIYFSLNLLSVNAVFAFGD